MSAGGDASDSSKIVLSVDIGTTVIKAHVYDKNACVKGKADGNIELLHPHPGWVELDEEHLLKQFVAVVKHAIKDAGLAASDITCLGITTQRNSFITWDKETGVPFHHFITWRDTRTKQSTIDWNSSYVFKTFRYTSKCLYMLSRSSRFLAGSVLKFMTAQVSLRLLWVMDNIPGLRQKMEQNQVRYGTVETWLLWKLTGGKSYATDYSCASGTGLYDLFQLEWSSIVCKILGIPLCIFPPVKDTSGHFGDISPEFFGASIPITALVGDQNSAMFGECCFEVGDVKLTAGTGTFLNLNTGRKAHASVAGLYPQIGWKIGDEITYLAEGMASDTGSCIEWAKSIDLFIDVSETSDIAESVEDTDGVYFISSFSGLQAPINDDKACTLMLGMKPSTTKAHMVRAVLESLAFRIKLLYETMLEETKIPLKHCRSNGGVTNNDFMMQLVSDLLNKPLERADNPGLQTSIGAAFLAGLGAGVWKSKDELLKLRKSGIIFEPRPTWPIYKPIVLEWERAMRRALQWYKD